MRAVIESISYDVIVDSQNRIEEAGMKAGTKDKLLIGSLILTAVSALSSFLMYWDTHRTLQNSVQDNQLNDAIDKRSEANIMPKLNEISIRLANIEGWREGLEGKVRVLDQSQKTIMDEQGQIARRLAQQESIARIENPNRILAAIRAEIDTAQSKERIIPASQLADYRNAMRILPSSAHEYWQTIASIVNYQSRMNQLSGKAPDPNKVSKPCIMGSFGGIFKGDSFSRCTTNLDSNSFIDTTFRDSVVIYRGGPLYLENVTFLNCRFILILPPEAPKEPQSSFLLALIDSPDQNFKISTRN